MCSLIIGIVVVIVLVALLLAGAMAMLLIVSGILFLASIGRYINSKKLVPSQMRCRNCGSSNVRLDSVYDGTDYGSTGDFFMGTYIHSGSSKVRHKRIAKCLDCGFTYDYVMPEEVAKEKQDAKNGMIGFGVIFFIALFFAMSVFGGKSGTEKKSATEESGKVWAAEVTPLDDFEYYIDGNEIYLKDYVGSSKAVYVPSSYTVDGAEMGVVSLDGTFTLKQIRSAIISDGIRYMSNNVFNSCGVEFVYLPASLENFDGWNYFHDVKKIYFSGSEETWNRICTIERSRLDVQQITCNASISDLIQ